MAGRPWLFRKKVVLFGRLREPIERKKLQLVYSLFWTKADPCQLESDRKYLMHAIGSTFGGL